MSKINWIRSVLRSEGYITRNQALQNYYSRLAAAIAVLKPEFDEEGFDIIGEDYGTDYRYKLKRKDALF